MATISQAPATLDLVAVKADDFTVTLTVTENSVAYDWTGATVATSILDGTGTAVATNFTATTSAGGVLTLTLTDANTTALGVGTFRWQVNVTKASATRTWLAGALSIMQAGWGGTSTSSASLSITTGAATIAISSTIAGAASNITVADSAGYLSASTVEAAISEMLSSNALIFDHFDRYSDGSLSGKVPVIGSAWSVSGAGTPTVTSGLLGNSSTGYAYIDCGATTPNLLACGVRYVSPTTANTMTMAWMTGATGTTFQVNDIGCHFNWGPTNYSVTLRQGGTFYTIMSGEWSVPMVAGTTYPVTAYIEGGKLTITANGDVRTSAYDVRLTTLIGPVVWWQPTTAGGTAAQIAWAYASAIPSGLTVPPNAYRPIANNAVMARGQVVGNQELNAQVQIGISTADNVSPGVNFGASTIRTYLTSAASSGQATFTANHPIPSGSSVILTGGTNGETVTTTGYPTGGGPFTHTATTNLTLSHLSNASVVATPTSTYQAAMYLNLATGHFWLPNTSVVVAPAGNFYLGSSLDTFVRRLSANLAAMGSGDSFQVDGTWNGGTFRMGSYYLWVDTSGRLRIKSGAPTSETDGTVVGTQV
jgi:hypothetical protein